MTKERQYLISQAGKMVNQARIAQERSKELYFAAADLYRAAGMPNAADLYRARAQPIVGCDPSSRNAHLDVPT